MTNKLSQKRLLNLVGEYVGLVDLVYRYQYLETEPTELIKKAKNLKRYYNVRKKILQQVL